MRTPGASVSGDAALALASAGSVAAMYLLLPLAHGWLAAALLISHGIALGVVPVVIADLMNRRIESSERRATLLSFESLVQRGSYGAVVIVASIALEKSSLTLVLSASPRRPRLRACCVPLATRGSEPAGPADRFAGSTGLWKPTTFPSGSSTTA